MAAKYQHVLEQLSTEIDLMAPGDRLPTERQLSERFDVSAMTIRRALQMLSEARRIVGVRGRGTFVAQTTVRKQMTLSSFTESMRAAGMTASTRLLSASLSPATPDMAEHLRLPEGEPCFTLERLRLGDLKPHCLEVTWLPGDLYPGLLGEDLTASLYELLRRRYGVVLERVRSRVSAILPGVREAELLEIKSSQPCIGVRSTTSSINEPDRVAESSYSLYRGDRYELLVESHSDSAAVRA